MARTSPEDPRFEADDVRTALEHLIELAYCREHGGPITDEQAETALTKVTRILLRHRDEVLRPSRQAFLAILEHELGDVLKAYADDANATAQTLEDEVNRLFTEKHNFILNEADLEELVIEKAFIQSTTDEKQAGPVETARYLVGKVFGGSHGSLAKWKSRHAKSVEVGLPPVPSMAYGLWRASLDVQLRYVWKILTRVDLSQGDLRAMHQILQERRSG
jgi:hypothetical protein